MEKFYGEKETKESSQVSDKHTLQPSAIFDVTTQYIAHPQPNKPRDIPQYSSDKERKMFPSSI
jgi:hypothetical protein